MKNIFLIVLLWSLPTFAEESIYQYKNPYSILVPDYRLNLDNFEDGWIPGTPRIQFDEKSTCEIREVIVNDAELEKSFPAPANLIRSWKGISLRKKGMINEASSFELSYTQTENEFRIMGMSSHCPALTPYFATSKIIHSLQKLPNGEKLLRVTCDGHWKDTLEMKTNSKDQIVSVVLTRVDQKKKKTADCVLKSK